MLEYNKYVFGPKHWANTQQGTYDSMNPQSSGPETSESSQEIQSRTRWQDQKQDSQVDTEQKSPERKVEKKAIINS